MSGTGRAGNSTGPSLAPRPGPARSAPGAQTGYRRHDPRIDPPTRQDKRRLWGWVALLAFCPVCLGVVVWAAIGLNGSYPTVKPPVPMGYKAERGIYASISVPRGWSLQQSMSDANGDAYYSGTTGSAGLSVVQDNHKPGQSGPLPAVVKTFLGASYRVTSVKPVKLHNAAGAWRYRLSGPGGVTGAAILAWVKLTQSKVWLVVPVLGPSSAKVLTTLTLAS